MEAQENTKLLPMDSEINAQLNVSNGAVDELYKEFWLLEERLADVLAVTPTSDTGTPIENSLSSPLGSRITVLNGRLNNLADMVRALTNRVRI